MVKEFGVVDTLDAFTLFLRPILVEDKQRLTAATVRLARILRCLAKNCRVNCVEFQSFVSIVEV